MRKIFNISVAALAMFGAIACSTAPVEEIIGNNTTVTASFVDSRTALSEGVKTVWSADDKIEVNGTTFTLSQGAGEATAVFVSEQRLADAESYVATYPAGVTAVPTTQSAVAGSFDPVAALASGTSVTLNNILFEHKHALLKFSLPQSASKVEVAGYTLAGNIEQGKTYYIAVAAGTYNIEVKVDDVVVKSSQNTLEAVNGHIYNLGLVEQPAIGIYTADDLVAFAAEIEAQIAAEQTPDGGKFKDANGVVNILANIDMKDVAWTPITDFAGTLNGNNFTIDNLVVTDATHAAMFKNLSGATIQNLVFGQGCSFTVAETTLTESFAGAVVAQVLTGATFSNIKNYATVSGGSTVGGICGGADLKKENILFENCENYGAISFPAIATTVEVRIGGICGQNEQKVTYVNCHNEGTITSNSTGATQQKLGGIIGGGSDHTMTNCTNSGTLTLNTRNANNVYFGGLIGCAYRGSVVDCSNTGKIEFADGASCRALYVAGCFGTLQGNNALEERYLYSNNSNSADIKVVISTTNDVILGGITGLFQLVDTDLNGCKNSGDLEMSCTVGNSCIGGIAGYAVLTKSGSEIKSVYKQGTLVRNCENTGDVFYNAPTNTAWVHVGGIVGGNDNNNITIDGCTNRGNVTMTTASRSNPGGIISQAQCDVKNCTNYGTIYSTDSHNDYFSGTAGIVSRLNANGITCSGCVNYGTIIYNGKGLTKVNANKGIVGQAGVVALCNYGTVENCENYGTILGNDYDASYGKASYINAKGSIVGWAGYNAAVTIKNCKVGGALGSCVDTDTDMGVAKAVAITAETYADYIFGGDAKNGVTVTDCSFAVSE